MANEKLVGYLRCGVNVWNDWRKSAPPFIEPDPSKAEPDLSKADFRQANLSGVDFTKANLSEANLDSANLSNANLRQANLFGADLTMARVIDANLLGASLSKANLGMANLSGANLSKAGLMGAYLTRANLHAANLSEADLEGANLDSANLSNVNLAGADLSGANLGGADLSGADLSGANLNYVKLEETNLENTDLTGCRVFGISVWNLKVNNKTKQSYLRINDDSHIDVLVDDLEVAQFINVLLKSQKLWNVLDTITLKTVLILGRFPPEREAILGAMADELRKDTLLPIIFDFGEATKSTDFPSDFTERIKTLARISLFVIADITNPKSAPLELQVTIPDCQIPFVPIIEEGEKPLPMFHDLTKYSWVSKTLTYLSLADLIKVFKKVIIDEAFEMHKKLLMSKAKDMEIRKVEDYLGEK